MSTTLLVDYGSGNVRSVARALAKAQGGRPPQVGCRPESLLRADRLVLPGVGAMAACMAKLQAIEGLVEALEEAVWRRGRPLLGICVGMQVFAQQGFEHEPSRALGWLPAVVERISPSDPALPIPHMGWNDLTFARPHALLDGLVDESSAVYFVHGYAMRLEQQQHALAYSDYGGQIVAMVQHETILGVQFHPEKSQAVGLRLLENFVAWRP